jgi:hypothetical protein
MMLTISEEVKKLQFPLSSRKTIEEIGCQRKGQLFPVKEEYEGRFSRAFSGKVALTRRETVLILIVRLPVVYLVPLRFLVSVNRKNIK